MAFAAGSIEESTRMIWEFFAAVNCALDTICCSFSNAKRVPSLHRGINMELESMWPAAFFQGLKKVMSSSLQNQALCVHGAKALCCLLPLVLCSTTNDHLSLCQPHWWQCDHHVWSCAHYASRKYSIISLQQTLIMKKNLVLLKQSV